MRLGEPAACGRRRENVSIHIAHVGAGQWSRYAHAPCLQRLAAAQDVSLEWICDLRIERALSFRDHFGYSFASDDLQQALALARPDALVCTVDPSASAALLRTLIPLGIPLLVEKPPALSAREAHELADLAEEWKTFVYVAFNRRASPALSMLKAWAAVHPIRWARAEMLRSNRLEPEFTIYTGIHLLDTLRFLMGDPITLDTQLIAHGDSGAQDVLARLQFADGKSTAEVSMRLDTGTRREGYLLSGEGASAQVLLGPPYGLDGVTAGYRAWQAERQVEEHGISGDELVDAGLVGQYVRFSDLLREGRSSTSDLRNAARSLQLAEAIGRGYSGPLVLRDGT